MADRVFPTVLTFQGGFATDLAPQVRELVFLDKAENLVYEVSGAVRKVGGTERINSVAITGSPDILGMFDFWLSGTGGFSTQKFVATTEDGKIYKDDMDGVFDDITGSASITANAIPVFCQARDLLTSWFSKNDTPLKWNQSGNVAALGGSPPKGTGAVFHINRVWTWGDPIFPSRLTFSSSTSVEDYTGPDTGSIDIEPEDGDRIIGAVSYKKNLVVFKGPYRGSIHTISGTAPTGSDAFSRTPLVRGIPLQTHNSIVSVLDDVWFMSDRGIHSLLATEKFGDFEGADLTRFLKGYFRNQINRTFLDRVTSAHYADKSCAVWGVTSTGGSENNQVFGLSYIRAQEDGLKALIWNRECLSAAIRINPSSKVRELVFGSSNGFTLRQDVGTRSLAGGTAYIYRIRTPSVILASTDQQGKPEGDQPVTVTDIYLKSKSVGDWNISVDLIRDDKIPETYTFNQAASGFILDRDLLDQGRLGGGNLQIAYPNNASDALGSARSIVLDITQGGANQDAEIYEVGIMWKQEQKSRESVLQ